VRFKKKPAKNYISLQLGVKLRNAPLFVPNWVSTCFDPVFPFSWAPPLMLHIYFHCSYIYNSYNYLEPCTLNAEFQHFIPRFNKNYLTLQTSLKEGIGGWKEAQRQGEDRMTLRKTFMNEVV
jgi:hypothetical protein